MPSKPLQPGYFYTWRNVALVLATGPGTLRFAAQSEPLEGWYSSDLTGGPWDVEEVRTLFPQYDLRQLRRWQQSLLQAKEVDYRG